MKKYSYIFGLTICALGLTSTLAYAHGDDDHDSVPIKKKASVHAVKPKKVLPAVEQPQVASTVQTNKTTVIKK